MHTTIAYWYVKDGKHPEAVEALKKLAEDVQEQEQDTWGYLVHTGTEGSLPPSSPGAIIFVEIYKNEDAFLAHVNGPVFQGFLKNNKDLFVSVPPVGQSYFQVQNLNRIDGFVRKNAT